MERELDFKCEGVNIHPCCSKKTCLICAASFLAAVALCRALDIVCASWEADVMVSDAATSALSAVISVLSVAAAAFSGGALIFFLLYGKSNEYRVSALLFSAVILADRAFYIVFSVLTGVKTFVPGSGADAYVRVIADALSFIAAYCATSFFGKRIKGSGKTSTENSEWRLALVFSAVLCAAQLIYQVYNTVVFLNSYNDVTSLEKTQIAGDYLFILLRYGVVMFGAVIASFSIIRKTIDERIRKKSGSNKK
ncbi:MAG: hypothetical protein IKN38_08825 [Clostridia bacterium]|nr:hypothetical protein [Clostridia bacterium]